MPENDYSFRRGGYLATGEDPTLTRSSEAQESPDHYKGMARPVGLIERAILHGQLIDTLMIAHGVKIRFHDGTVGIPSIAFGPPRWEDGFYAIGLNNVGLAIAGAIVSDWNATRTQLTGDLNWSADNTYNIGGASGNRPSIAYVYAALIMQGRAGLANVFNELGLDQDTRFEGDTNANLFFLDASTDSIGIGTSTPKSRFDINGSFSRKLSSVSGDTILDITHSTVLVDASGGAVTITLPTASGITGRIYTIKKTDSSANTVTVDGDGAETIDGAATHILRRQYNRVTVQSDSSNWMIIA